MKDVIETKTCMGLRSHDTERRGIDTSGDVRGGNVIENKDVYGSEIA